MRSADVKPLVCLIVRTGTGSSILVTNNDVDIKFPTTTGSTYTARPMTTGEIKVSGTDTSPFDVTFGDGAGFWDTWLVSTDFRFQRVTRLLVERDSLGAADRAHVDTFRVRSVDRADKEVTFHTEPLRGILQTFRVPKIAMTRENYPGIPDDHDVVR
jgi:hypothetical protein